MEKVNLKVNFLFKDHMVLQREKEVCVWGTIRARANVAVVLTDEADTVVCEGAADANSEGAWIVKLPPQPAGRGLAMQIKSGEECIRIHDVAFGEVWIAAGQSNMEFAMRYDADYKTEELYCANADIRFFDTPRICCAEQEETFDYREYGLWKPCDAGHLQYFSAVGYYFAKELQEQLQVPVGIVGCNRGGSIAAAWMNDESLRRHGGKWLEDYSAYTPEVCRQELEKYCSNPMANTAEPFADAVSDELMYGMSRERQMEIMASIPSGGEGMVMLPPFDNRPGCLYRHMLKRIVPYAVRGVLWYQGESDCMHPENYGELFLDLVELWRNEWGDQLPFLSVQLAPFGCWMMCEGERFPEIRAQQEKAAEQGKDIYLISSSDCGMRYDIHPKKKAPIGHRLALCAQAEIYGRDVEWKAPVGTEVKYQDGELRVTFSNGEGLWLQGEGMCAFTIMGQNETVY